MKTRGFTLLELLIVVAIGGGLLTGVAYMLNLGVRAHNAGAAEAEARQAIEFAFEQIGRAVRETREVLVPNSSRLNRNDANPTKNTLAVGLSPTLDANADGYPDADNDLDGVVDWQVRRFIAGQSPQYPLRSGYDLPLDMTYDSSSGIRGVDDDGNGVTDEATCWNTSSNDEVSCAYNWNYDRNSDWLDVVVFMVQTRNSINLLVQRQPTPRAANGQAWTNHILASNVSSFTVKLVTGGGARDLVEVGLCLAVDTVDQVASRVPVCALRVWRVGGGT